MSDNSDKQANRIKCGRKLVGGNIRRLRLGHDMSQEELAHEAGINRAYLSTVENGKRNISIDNIIAISNALDVDAREMLRPLDDNE
jgi:transcriptional regulator with XRE-family HTH domain